MGLPAASAVRRGHLALRQRRRCASTLIELMVTLAVVAILTGVTTLAIRRIAPVRDDAPSVRLTAARRTALRTGRAVTISRSADGALYTATAFADGTVVADSSFHVDRLTGMWLDTSRARTEPFHAR